MTIIRRYAICGLMLVALVFTLTRTVAAQPPAATPAMPSNSRVVGRSFAVEGIIVVILMAGAGFAVCRSSRRM